MKILQTLTAFALASVGLLATTQATAGSLTFNAAGDSGTVTFSCPGCSNGLSATLEITLTTLGATSAVFTIKITNNSTLAADRLTAFSFVDITPDLSGCATATAGWDATCGVNAGGGFNPVELCTWDGVNCNGGSNEGVAGAGGTETIQLTMSFTAGVPPITFDTFVAKFQGPNGSFHLSDGGDGTDGDVPEPGTLALFALGLLGLGLRGRRRLI